MPLVSVVMPCYNAARYVGEAIHSVLDQTLQDFELIVVDDGSTDHTRDMVAEFRDSRIRYVYQENRGPSAARNAGVTYARSEYIAPLDADDLALPHRLAAQYSALALDPAISVVGSGYVWIDEEGRRMPWVHHSWQSYPELNRLNDWLLDCPFVPSATMLRRTAWQDVAGFDEGLRGGEDWNFWMRLVLKNHRMIWHRDIVCLYRHRSDSLSRDAQRMSADCTEALCRVINHPDFPSDLLKTGRAGLALRYVDGAKRLYTRGLWTEAKAALEESLRLDPSLMAGRPPRIEDDLLDAAMDPLVEDPICLLEGMLNHLPDNAQALQAKRPYLLARCHLESLVRGLRRHNLQLIRQHLIPAAAIMLRRSLYGNACAFIMRAIENRLTRFISIVGSPKKGTAN